MGRPNYGKSSKGGKYSNNKSRGRDKYRNTSKGKITRPDERSEVAAEGDINNPAYYYENATVLDQVMNFSFNEFGGMPIEFDFDGSGSNVAYANKLIASYQLNPSIPESASTNSLDMTGVMTASLRNFLKLSGSNAKTTNYAPQDVALLILAIAEIIKVSVFLRRPFGIAYLFNYRNRTYPEMLLKAMGIDADDFFDHLADYRVRYNRLLAVASKIPFPADIPLFLKAAELYGSIYVDDNSSALAQTYLFNPNSTWIFNETYDSNGAGLETLAWTNPGSPTYMSMFLDKFETMLTALLTSTSLNYIYADIMRCVQKGYITNLISFQPIAESYFISPVYNEEVKTWIHNATILGAPLDTAQQASGTTYALTPKNDVSCMAGANKVFYHPQFKVAGPCGYSALIDFDHDNVTIEDKVRATRFSQRWTTILNSGDYYTNELALADEYLVSAVFYPDPNNTKAIPSSFRFITSSNPNTIWMATEADYLSKFDWAPILYYKDDLGGLNIVGDLDYYTVIDFNLVKKIYDYEIIHLISIG